jgi:hypothetical protein
MMEELTSFLIANSKNIWEEGSEPGDFIATLFRHGGAYWTRCGGLGPEKVEYTPGHDQNPPSIKRHTVKINNNDNIAALKNQTGDLAGAIMDMRNNHSAATPQPHSELPQALPALYRVGN